MTEPFLMPTALASACVFAIPSDVTSTKPATIAACSVLDSAIGRPGSRRTPPARRPKARVAKPLDISGDWVMTLPDAAGKATQVDEATFSVEATRPCTEATLTTRP